jgi:hypothetical protein
MGRGGKDTAQTAGARGSGVDARKLIWGYILLLTLACAGAVIVVGVIMKMAASPRFAGDFTVFWAAAKAPIADVYNWSALERSQVDAIGKVGPFAYPPTTLLLLKPFGLLPFPMALGSWAVISSILFLAAARALIGWRELALAILSPAIVIAVATGQTSLIVGALILGGLTAPGAVRRGAMIGLAAAIKPQMVFLFPVAFIAARDWRALGSAFAAGALAVGVTLLLWGVQPWFDWLASLPQFTEVLRRTGIGIRSVTPASLAMQAGLEKPVMLVGLALGALLVWKVFRTSPEPLDRVAALCLGGLLGLPYALSYDMTALIVAITPVLLNRSGTIISWAGAGMIFSTTLSQVGVVLASIDIFRRHSKAKIREAP